MTFVIEPQNYVKCGDCGRYDKWGQKGFCRLLETEVDPQDTHICEYYVPAWMKS